MNKIATPDLSTVEVLDSAREKITVLNPVGYPPKVAKKSAAPRLESLDGKTIYLVDCRFDDSVELLKQVQAWFAEHMPSVKTPIISLSATYQHDDPKTWDEIKANGRRGDRRRRPLQHLRARRRHPRHHARDQVRRADRRAAHRQVRQGGAVGDQDGGPAGRAARLRAAAGHGQDAPRSCAPTSTATTRSPVGR